MGPSQSKLRGHGPWTPVETPHGTITLAPVIRQIRYFSFANTISVLFSYIIQHPQDKSRPRNFPDCRPNVLKIGIVKQHTNMATIFTSIRLELNRVSIRIRPS